MALFQARHQRRLAQLLGQAFQNEDYLAGQEAIRSFTRLLVTSEFMFNRRFNEYDFYERCGFSLRGNRSSPIPQTEPIPVDTPAASVSPALDNPAPYIIPVRHVALGITNEAREAAQTALHQAEAEAIYDLDEHDGWVDND